MLPLINEGPALDIHKRYFSILEKTGYLKHDSILRFLAYIFLLDLVDYAHAFFEEEDYTAVSKALGMLFADGGCLMPYPIFCTNRATVGRNEYMGTLKIRKTEDLSGYKDRFTEDDNPRTV